MQMTVRLLARPRQVGDHDGSPQGDRLDDRGGSAVRTRDGDAHGNRPVDEGHLLMRPLGAEVDLDPELLRERLEPLDRNGVSALVAGDDTEEARDALRGEGE